MHKPSIDSLYGSILTRNILESMPNLLDYLEEDELRSMELDDWVQFFKFPPNDIFSEGFDKSDLVEILADMIGETNKDFFFTMRETIFCKFSHKTIFNFLESLDESGFVDVDTYSFVGSLLIGEKITI